MTEQELYRCESHERRVASLEDRIHIQDKATAALSSELNNIKGFISKIDKLEESVIAQDKSTALLSSEVRNLSDTVRQHAEAMKEQTTMLGEVRKTLQVVLPKVEVSRQWEKIYQAGIVFAIGAGCMGIWQALLKVLFK